MDSPATTLDVDRLRDRWSEQVLRASRRLPESRTGVVLSVPSGKRWDLAPARLGGSEARSDHLEGLGVTLTTLFG